MAPTARLNPLDAGFLALESSQAPMHLGWAAVFATPAEGPRPAFEAIRAHIEARLDRAPRYRQRLAEVPLGIAEPAWVDDESFDLARHVRRASSTDLGELADQVMSVPLAPDRPLWELWIAERLDDGHVGVVGKAHHALVDGLAAVELMGLLLDATPDHEQPAGREWRPAPTPGPLALVGAALHDRGARALAGPGRALDLARNARRAARHGVRCARAVSRAALPLAPKSPLNGATSPARHLAWTSRRVEDLKLIERHFGATVNDVFLAASADAIRDLLLARGEHPGRLKAMVPVSVRAPEERWGNRIAFVFPPLPSDEPDPERRLSDVHTSMCELKRAHAAEAADTVIGASGRMPRPIRDLASRLLTSPRLSNLTISNVPGPTVPLYLKGCEVKRVYPVVPLAGGHGVSIGMTSFNGHACFGIYADASRAFDADRLARRLGAAIDELLARVRRSDPASQREHDRTSDIGPLRQAPRAPVAFGETDSQPFPSLTGKDSRHAHAKCFRSRPRAAGGVTRKRYSWQCGSPRNMCRPSATAHPTTAGTPITRAATGATLAIRRSR